MPIYLSGAFASMFVNPRSADRNELVNLSELIKTRLPSRDTGSPFAAPTHPRAHALIYSSHMTTCITNKNLRKLWFARKLRVSFNGRFTAVNVNGFVLNI